MWRLIRLWVWIPLIRWMEHLIRVHRKSLGTLILKWRSKICKTLVWIVGALVVWQVMWVSLISPTKIRVLTPSWIICFKIWRIERFPLVVKGINLLYLNCSLNLRKVWAVNILVRRVIAYDAWLLHSGSKRYRGYLRHTSYLIHLFQLYSLQLPY